VGAFLGGWEFGFWVWGFLGVGGEVGCVCPLQKKKITPHLSTGPKKGDISSTEKENNGHYRSAKDSRKKRFISKYRIKKGISSTRRLARKDL